MGGESQPGTGQVAAWETLSKRKVADCRIFKVASKRCRHPIRGSESEFYVIETTNWANVLALTTDCKAVLVRQYRFGTERTSWELPGGVIDEGEEPVEAALRELEEETGYVSKKARLLGEVNPNPAIMDNRCFMVLAEGAERRSEQSWDPHEEIEMKIVSLDELYRMAFEGEITHSLMLNTLLYYYPEWERQKRRRRPI